jgi:nucleotide-binding universal stress UspA family protein
VYDFHVAWIDHDLGAEHLVELRDRARAEARAELHQVIEDVVADLAKSSMLGRPPDVEELVIEGRPARVLVDLAREGDLLVVGSRGRGRLGGLLLGSVSQHCVERASCPTAVVMTDSPVTRIVVGIDGSPSAQAALAWAVDEAATRGACVDAVCAYLSTIMVSPHPAVPTVPTEKFRKDASKLLDNAIKQLPTTHGVSITPTVMGGPAAEVLEACAADADLVVMGTRGLGGVKGLVLGSVTRRVMTHVTCPVVVVPDATHARVADTAVG